jgi:hypothetical protein
MNKTESDGVRPFEINLSGTGSIVDGLKALAVSRDQVLYEAIRFNLGDTWLLVDLLERCEIIKHIDGREQFALDGVSLVEFYPHELIMLVESLTITQKYRKLYLSKEVH